jgi:hypothetical protein
MFNWINIEMTKFLSIVFVLYYSTIFISVAQSGITVANNNTYLDKKCLLAKSNLSPFNSISLKYILITKYTDVAKKNKIYDTPEITNGEVYFDFTSGSFRDINYVGNFELDETKSKISSWIFRNWDGQRYIEWVRPMPEIKQSEINGYIFDNPGTASINSQFSVKPYVLIPWLDDSIKLPIEKKVDWSKASNFDNTPEFLKIAYLGGLLFFDNKTGKLLKRESQTTNQLEQEITFRKITFDNHIAINGILFPTKITRSEFTRQDGALMATYTYFINKDSVQLNPIPQSLNTNNIKFPVGCAVVDRVEKKTYTVTGYENVDILKDNQKIIDTLDQLLEFSKEQTKN